MASGEETRYAMNISAQMMRGLQDELMAAFDAYLIDSAHADVLIDHYEKLQDFIERNPDANEEVLRDANTVIAGMQIYYDLEKRSVSDAAAAPVSDASNDEVVYAAFPSADGWQEPAEDPAPNPAADRDYQDLYDRLAADSPAPQQAVAETAPARPEQKRSEAPAAPRAKKDHHSLPEGLSMRAADTAPASSEQQHASMPADAGRKRVKTDSFAERFVHQLKKIAHSSTYKKYAAAKADICAKLDNAPDVEQYTISKLDRDNNCTVTVQKNGGSSQVNIHFGKEKTEMGWIGEGHQVMQGNYDDASSLDKALGIEAPGPSAAP